MSDTIVVNVTESSVIEVPTGATGPQGYSAYQVAVENGFVGTEQEWLDSLVGPAGAQGIQGIQGIQGVQGVKGDTGATGATGTSGVVSVTAPLKNSGTSSAAALSMDPAFGGFFDTTQQQLASISAEQQVLIGQTAYVHYVTRTNSGDIVATVAGNYRFTYTATFSNSDSQIQYANLYVKFNSGSGFTVVPGTNTVITVPGRHGATNGYATGGQTFIVPMAVGHAIQLWWAGTNVGLAINQVPAASYVPAADSVLLSIDQIGS